MDIKTELTFALLRLHAVFYTAQAQTDSAVKRLNYGAGEVVH